MPTFTLLRRCWASSEVLSCILLFPSCPFKFSIPAPLLKGPCTAEDITGEILDGRICWKAEGAAIA
jgi:hypothetical protein